MLPYVAQVRQISLTKTVDFCEYAPRVWQWLRRELYGTSSEDYVRSMAQEAGGSDLSLDRSFSEAKGGGYFFFSADRRFLVKTMTSAELHTLLSILPSYCRYMLQRRSSMISRIFGAYSITSAPPCNRNATAV